MVGWGSPGGGDGVRGDAAPDAGAPSEALSPARRELATIAEAIGHLRDLPLWTFGQQDLLTLTGDVETMARSTFGVQVRLAGEISERGVAGVLDARFPAHLLHEVLQITISDARTRVAAAAAALPGETRTGDAVAPTAPELMPAIDTGDISAGHAKVITGCLSRIPAAVDEGTRRLCRAALTEQAGVRDENGLRQVADQILAMVDPDGKLSGKDPEDRAELHIGAKRQDGITPIRGGLSPLVAEQLRAALDPLSQPRPVDENTPDPRPAPLRREQALGEVLSRYLAAGAGPRDGGLRPQVVVTINLADLIAALQRRRADGADTPPDVAAVRCPAGGSAWSDYGGVQTAAMARLLACDAQLIPQVLGSDGVVLDQGRAVRLFTAAQRRAITTRDRGCAFPGCDCPPGWTEAHHIRWWSFGGATDTENGVLLCRRHHVLIHQGRWSIHADPDGGRPWFVPPAHIDAARKPRRNSHFHLSDLISAVNRQ